MGFVDATAGNDFHRREAIDPIVDPVARYADPDEPVFVALTDNRGHFANAAALYWIVDRPPISRFIECNPCLTDRNDIQQLIVEDLRGTDVVVQSTFFANPPPKGWLATVLDDHLRREFTPVAETMVGHAGERYVVVVRRSLANRPPRERREIPYSWKRCNHLRHAEVIGRYRLNTDLLAGKGRVIYSAPISSI